MHHFLCISVIHKSLVLIMCHFFWSPLTLQDTSYSPEPHISADRSQSLLSAQEAVSLWVLGTRKVCISAESPRDAILIHCFKHQCCICSHTNVQTNIFFLFLPCWDSFCKIADFYNLNNYFFNEISTFFPLNNKNILANFEIYILNKNY